MNDFYPALQLYARHSLTVDAPHILNIEEYGNPAGFPVLVVHGGPGAASDAHQARVFDPHAYRIILYDQRGCGRSIPHGELEGNTTQALVSDMEAIRNFLNIDRWILMGGSWGSTLSLIYAETYPERVAGLILRGIFLCRQQDIDWFYQHGADLFYPDYWQDFVRPIPTQEQNDLVAAYYRILTGDDEIARMSAAKAWATWEGRLATLELNEMLVAQFNDPFRALALARVECHYFRHAAFLRPDQILADAHRLRTIPGVIVHGRYDMVCPVDNAWQLHCAWPQADLRLISCAGHSLVEPAIRDAVIGATKGMRLRVS